MGVTDIKLKCKSNTRFMHECFGKGKEDILQQCRAMRIPKENLGELTKSEFLEDAARDIAKKGFYELSGKDAMSLLLTLDWFLYVEKNQKDFE